MSTIAACVAVAAAPERVWQVLVDIDRLGEWMGPHRGFPHGPPDELRAGERYAQEVAAAGQEVDVCWTIEEVSAPRRVILRGEGPAGATAAVVYELEPDGEGTRLSSQTTYELPGGPLSAVAGQLAANQAEEEAEASLQRLRRLAEAD